MNEGTPGQAHESSEEEKNKEIEDTFERVRQIDEQIKELKVKRLKELEWAGQIGGEGATERINREFHGIKEQKG